MPRYVRFPPEGRRLAWQGGQRDRLIGVPSGPSFDHRRWHQDSGDELGVVRHDPAVERIAVVGCIGAGKSTVARPLGRTLGIEVFHLDRYW